MKYALSLQREQKTSHKTNIISHGTNGKNNSRASRSREREKARLLHQAKGWGTIIGPIDVETSVVNILTSIVSILTGLAEFACNEPARRVHAYFALARIYPQPDIFLRNIGLREEKKKKKEKKKITDSCSFSLVSCTLSHAPFVRHLTTMPHRHLPVMQKDL